MPNNNDKKGEQNSVVEIPVVLEKTNVVFNLDHLAFAGDVPVAISCMHLLTNRFREMNTTRQTCRVQRRSNGEKPCKTIWAATHLPRHGRY